MSIEEDYSKPLKLLVRMEKCIKGDGIAHPRVSHNISFTKHTCLREKEIKHRRLELPKIASYPHQAHYRTNKQTKQPKFTFPLRPSPTEMGIPC